MRSATETSYVTNEGHKVVLVSPPDVQNFDGVRLAPIDTKLALMLV